MTKTYAIADLHGRFDLLELALETLAAEEPGTIVFLGDYVDRGPDSAGIIKRLMEGPPAGWTWICLLGNHEDMMLMTLLTPKHPQWWIQNGGGATLISYGHPREGTFMPEVVPREHLKWLAELPLFHADKHRVYVHAGVDPDLTLDMQVRETLLWKRYGHNNSGHYALHVVHGHEVFQDGPLQLAGRTGLDTGAYHTSILSIGVFDDDRPGGAERIIQVVGDSFEELMAKAEAV